MTWKHILALVLLAATLVVLFVALPPDGGAEGKKSAERSNTTVERTRAILDGPRGTGDLATVADQATEREATLPSEAPDDGPRVAAGDLGGEVVGLTVEVAWPVGTAPIAPDSDADLTVYAFDRDIAAGILARTFASTPGAGRRAPPSVFDELEDPTQSKTAVRASLLAEAQVVGDSEGGWRATLEIPDGRRRVFVHALGAGAFTETSTEVFLPAETATVSPTRGASLELAAAASNELEGIDLSDTFVRVRVARDAANMMAMGATDGSSFGANVLLDEDGRVVLPTVPAGIGLDLEIRHDDLAAIDLAVSPLEPGEARKVELEIRRGARILGRVTDGEGREVADARVTASMPGEIFGLDDEMVSETTTDDQGRFTLERIPDGIVIVRADNDDALESNRIRVEIEGGEDASDVTIALAEGKTISGVARYDNGAPAGGVQITAQFDVSHVGGPSGLGAMRGAKSRAVSDDDGTFVIKGLGGGPFSVRAAAHPEGLDDAPRWRARLDGVRPGAEDVALTLGAPLTVAGLVTDDQGAPIPDLDLFAARVVPGSMGDMRLDYRGAQTDDEGRFGFDEIVAGRWTVAVSTEEWVSLEDVSFDVTGPVEGATVQVVRTGSISGVVLDPDGDPISGAVVEQSSETPDWQQALSRKAPSARTRTDENGQFLLLAVRPGTVRVAASAEDMSPALADAIELEPGAHVEGVELRLTNGGAIEGLCFDDEGNAAAGRIVTVQSTTLSTMRTVPSNDDGSFLVRGLPEGKYQIVAMDPGVDMSGDADSAGLASMFESMDMASADVVEGETAVVYLGAPPADPVEVTGTVERGGEPYTDAMVAWMPASKNMYEQMKMATTDAEGNYRVTLDQPGDYIVSVTRLRGGTGQQETVEFSEAVPSASEHDRDFEIPGGVIAGRVVGTDGEPVSGTRVTIMARGAVRTDRLFGGSYAEIPTDAQGRFEANGLRPGTYQVAAGGQAIFGDSATAPARTIVGDFELGRDERVDGVEIQLTPPGALEITVRDAAGVGVEGATVFLRDGDGRHTELFSMNVTDPSGRVTVRGLGPGSYTVAARTAELASQESAPATVVAGETGEASVLLEAGATIHAVMRAKGDASIPAASVQVLDSHGRDVTRRLGLTDMQTMYADAAFSTTERRIGPIPLGRYKVIATSGDGRTGKRNVTLDAPGVRRVSVVLR